MTRFDERYATAVHSGNLRSSPDTQCSDSDVIGAAGLAAKRRPLALALLRLFMADNGAAAEVVRMLAEMATTKAYKSDGVVLTAAESTDIARAVLAWHRDGVCTACGGHGFKLAGSQHLGEGRAVLSDAACDECRGTRKVEFDREFAIEHLWIARWLRAEIEREQAAAGSEAMRALAPAFTL